MVAVWFEYCVEAFHYYIVIAIIYANNCTV
jgi:hypothetical protein